MRVVACTAVGLALASCQPSPKAASAMPEDVLDRASLIQFADLFDQAQLMKNGPALERMIDDDLVFIGGTGHRMGKKEFIGGWTGAGDRFDPITLADRIVVPLGDSAGMVSAETRLSGTSNGKAFSSHIRYTDTFRKIRGEWRAVHIQVTRILDRPAS